MPVPFEGERPVRRLRVRQDQCTGCESCVLTCSFEHGDRFGLHLSRVRVVRNEEEAEFRPKVCVQCEERPCIAACPVGALGVDGDTGAIRISETLCTGCQQCGPACAFDGVHFTDGVTMPFICDLCGGSPECAQVCQLPQAVAFVERE
ncbi:4Fe-4S dicluster domain-containing protein [Candidatus Bipolaricaulota bacterium]